MRTLVCLSIALLAAACTPTDEEPPPPPVIDPVASPTGASRVVITGTAEFGARIGMSGATFEPAEVYADPFTAEFRVVSTLTPNTTNSLTFTATDAAGNTSPPTTVTVEQVDGFGVGVVAVENVRVNGLLCMPSGTPIACVVNPDDFVEFDITATNLAAVSMGYSAWFQIIDRLETLSLFVPSNAGDNPTLHFQFTIPGNALPEDVDIVAHATDAGGNEFTSAGYLLRVSVFATGGRAVEVVAARRLVNGPNDVAFDSNGNLYIANDGGSNLLKLATGSTFPTRYSPYNRNSDYLAVAADGQVYATDGDVFRVTADGASFVCYAANVPGAALGMDVVAPTAAKAIVSASGASDGDRVTVGAISYELDNNASCTPTPTRVCVTYAVGQQNPALATAINGSPVVTAAHHAASNTVVLAARTTGEGGNQLTLTANNIIILRQFEGGHGEEIFLGTDGDVFLYRMPEILTPTADLSADNHGVFDVADPQRGVAVNYVSTATSLDTFAAYIYFIDDGNRDRLVAQRHVDAPNPPPTAVFTTTHGARFDTLYDVARAPNGCLLISDEATGDIWSVDVRNPSNNNPAVNLVASGFDQPRGLAFSGNDLFIADRGLDAIIKISPAAGGDCF